TRQSGRGCAAAAVPEIQLGRVRYRAQNGLRHRSCRRKNWYMTDGGTTGKRNRRKREDDRAVTAASRLAPRRVPPRSYRARASVYCPLEGSRSGCFGFLESEQSNSS